MGCSQIVKKSNHNSNGNNQEPRTVSLGGIIQVPESIAKPIQNIIQPQSNQAPTAGPIQVKVVVRHKGAEILSSTYEDKYIIENMINEIKAKQNFSRHGEYIFTCNGSVVDPRSKNLLKTLLVQGKEPSIVLDVQYKGLEIPQDALDKSVQIVQLGKWLTKTPRLSIFDTASGKFRVDSLDAEALRSYPELEIMNETSAYCNVPGSIFFISGGEEETPENPRLVNSLYLIDLNTCNVVKKIPLSSKRINHSMIYVPDDYVFLVGGQENLQVEYYSLKSNELIPHSKMNAERLDPALYLVDSSYLYAFSYFSEKVRYFERINLRSSKKEWQIINPTLKPGVQFTQSFFAVCPLSEKELIFLGGKETEKLLKDGEEVATSHIFNLHTNEINQSDLRYKVSDLAEKTFYPSTDLNFYTVPNTDLGKCEVLIFNPRDRKLNSKVYEDVDLIGQINYGNLVFPNVNPSEINGDILNNGDKLNDINNNYIPNREDDFGLDDFKNFGPNSENIGNAYNYDYNNLALNNIDNLNQNNTNLNGNLLNDGAARNFNNNNYGRDNNLISQAEKGTASLDF